MFFTLKFSSKTIVNSESPVWNEHWIVRNISKNSTLTVKIFDEDDDKLIDDKIGHFEISDMIGFQAPSEGVKIVGPFGVHQGNFHLTIEATLSDSSSKELPPYTFDGPCRYARHDSLLMGILTKVKEDLVYSTWKIELRRISHFFPPGLQQHWNKNYSAAQKIFGNCPTSIASQGMLKVAHKALHGRKLKHYEDGNLNSAEELWKIIFTDNFFHCVKPCIFTYVIDDEYWRFSQTGHQFFTDFASKHALLANASKYVRYAGEFHTRPVNGWNDSKDEWELVFDNGSGTYSPTPELLENLENLMKFNFPGLKVATYDYEDCALKESVKQLKKAMKRYDQMTPTIDKLVEQLKM